MKATLQSKNLQFKTDISIGVKNAADAVGLICQYVSRTPIVRPLVLVLKALLKEKNLNEVYTGGISSYVLFNLVCSSFSISLFLVDRKLLRDPIQLATSEFVDGTIVLMKYAHLFTTVHPPNTRSRRLGSGPCGYVYGNMYLLRILNEIA